MYTEEFNYYLPNEYIAQYPEKERSSSRLLVFDRRKGTIEDRLFKDIHEYLKKGDVLVLNKSKVFPARLEAQKETGGMVRILLVEEIGTNQWRCLVRGVKRGMSELRVSIGNRMAELLCKDGSWVIHFLSDSNFYDVINTYGKVPLPPYIKRKGSNGDIDIERYQTVYAEDVGSIAAPTAGFHFTDDLLELIEGMGVHIVKIVLHIGIGTFLLVKRKKIEDHEMAYEYYSMMPEVKDIIDRAKKEGRRVIACGTSVVRTLETVFSGNDVPLQGRTGLFIYPDYQFKVVDALITNFHLPKSTPLLLTAAFAGKNELFNCYLEAQEKGYRFYSYGDGMFIL